MSTKQKEISDPRGLNTIITSMVIPCTVIDSESTCKFDVNNMWNRTNRTIKNVVSGVTKLLNCLPVKKESNTVKYFIETRIPGS